ncbi:MAG: hypothetical protein IKS49_07005 [Actinomycetaceae bacterium]|nr:hypothetical protein [Actinomycetaceae bacterium]
MYSQADCIEKYGSKHNIGKAIEEGELYRLERGIYSEKEYVPELAILTFKYPKAIVTMRTAWFIHGLTDVLPGQYDLATDRDAAKITDKRVIQYFCPKEILANGLIEMDYQGYPIRIYDKERMLVELMRYKSKIPFDYYKEVVLNYRKILPALDIRKIEDYAMASPKRDMIMESLRLEVL